MKHAVVTLVYSSIEADQVIKVLEASGFSMSDISLLMPDTSGVRDLSFEKHSKAPEGTATGAGAGAVIGGTVGVLAGVGAVVIPGLGPFIAAGPIMAGLGGAAIGGSLGGIVGGLIGLGMPEYEANMYESKVKDGAILISVHTENNEEAHRAKTIFKHLGGKHVSILGEEKVKKAS